ncbi:ABC transporter ATP-binding protein [Bifidobacterium apis]|uniref:ABC transporter ATP-binding protein n=1 Tax=Bifidobacterium apis TaxID=3081440 RepID=UPI0030D9B327
METGHDGRDVRKSQVTAQGVDPVDGDTVLRAMSICYDYSVGDYHRHNLFGRSHDRNGLTSQIGPVNVQLQDGCITALIGPSGCGKSTVLKLLAGILTPSRGEVWYGHRDIARQPDFRRARLRRTEFAFIFQDYMLVDSLTVAENIILPMSLNGSAADGGAVRRALAYVDLPTGVMGRKVSELSGGQQQRVAIARAMIMDAQVLFADEPTGNLDPRAREDTLDAIRAAMSAGLRASLLVTHDARVASRADRILYMRDGRICGSYPHMDQENIERLLLSGSE